MKKQSCRMTTQEKEVHKEAGKLRRMTDQQLIDHINRLKAETEKAESKAQTMAALAEEKEHEAEIARRAADAAAEAMSQKVQELSAKNKKNGHMPAREAVKGFLDKLGELAGSGNGIGRGTIYKLGKILDSMTDEELNQAQTAEV